MATALSDRILFVSAGMLAPKKRDHPLARRQLYLNYGALTLATQASICGADSILVHGWHEDPGSFLARQLEEGRIPCSSPIMLSIPSFYALPWAQSFCRLLKHLVPDSRIVAGGRWVVGPDVDWFRGMLPEADVLVPGMGEPLIMGLLNGEHSAPGRVGAATPSFALDHRLVEGHLRYQPSVEASRGCGMGCAFCEERDIPLEPLRDPAVLASHLEAVAQQYGSAAIHPYFQSSFFAPSSAWAKRFAAETSDRGLKVQWRTETRVDGMKPETVTALAKAGLTVLDLGLETASPRQIHAMAKSRDAERYLRKASELLRACRDSGVMVKANVLLYAGETMETLDETASWLDERRDCIKGVSVGPVVAFGPPKTAGILLDGWRNLGAHPVDDTAAARTGITAMHLSPLIDAACAEALSLEVSRSFMDADDYFDLKSFSYYARDYTKADFFADVRISDPATLPFQTGYPRTNRCTDALATSGQAMQA